MRLRCGLCVDDNLGDTLTSTEFARAIREHKIAHAAHDPVLRMISPTFFALVARRSPDATFQIGNGPKFHYEVG